MTTRVAPWLEGLSEAWEMPQKTVATNSISSASHDAGSSQSNKSRIPRPSLGGHASSTSGHNSVSRNATQARRNPLAPLNSNDGNSLRRHNSTTKVAGSRSVSEASNGSLLACGTVQRPKSASPSKKQQTLEWKRRLLDRELGYGDQTDLFGPTGLENIFTRSTGPENQIPKPKNRVGWLQKSDVPMPSSPPPWPSCFVDESEMQEASALQSVDEERSSSHCGDQGFHQESFVSNPFDLESSRVQQDACGVSNAQSNPDEAFSEPAQDEVVQNRTISGQTELEQEDFSPVFVSKHKTVSGQVSYAALDSHLVKQFQSQEVDLRHPSQQQPAKPPSESNGLLNANTEQSTFTHGPSSVRAAATPDLSFSDDLPTGSPFPPLSANVQVQRKGRLQHGPTYDQPDTSSPPAKMDDSLNKDVSGLHSPVPTSERLPTASTPAHDPATPAQQDGPTSRSSRSPLKLFTTHDTFTNNRLLRRMSQLNPDGTLRRGVPEDIQHFRHDDRQVSGSSFGSGQLNDYSFNAEITITSASDSDKDDSDRSPGSDIPPPGSKSPFAFRFAVSPEVTDTFKMKRRLSKQNGATSGGTTLESRRAPVSGLHAVVEDVSGAELNIVSNSEENKQYEGGKRPPTSPFKNPTPKRRRTLHASELESGITAMNDSYHSQLQEAVSGRKRKDARQGDIQNTADPETLAQRKILRPRNPTPSQRRRQQIQAELKEAAEEFADQEPARLEAVMEQIDSSMVSDSPSNLEQQAQTLASEVAAFTLRVQKPSGEQGERKRSVTTQDFLNEAMMVMNLIRAKARPQNNLGSVEESEAEAYRHSLHAHGDQQDESLLRVSRPPSRESSGWRPRAPIQTDARVVSHLRKFQEQEDIDDTNFIANSIASLQVDNEDQVNEQVVVVDEQANVRITGPIKRPENDQPDSGSHPDSQRSRGSTLGTQNSGGTSTGRTMETNSTRKSDNVGTLAPNAVAHLIGNQVGGMTFDREQQRWVRVSKSLENGHGSFLELPSNVTSDDDPFREISDLPVDEHKEFRQLSSGGNGPDALPNVEATREEEAHSDANTRTTSQETVIPRPVTRDSSHVQPNHSSSVPSKYTAFASSQQAEQIETRATSWSDEELARMSALGKGQRPLADHGAETLAQVDAETLPRAGGAVQQSIVSDNEVQTGSAKARMPATNDFQVEQLNDDRANLSKQRQTPQQPRLPPRPTCRTATKATSLHKRTLNKFFDYEGQEESELSIVAPLPGDRMISLSLSVSRPKGIRAEQQRKVTELEASPSKVNSSYILSDLPDFTIHEEDEERPSERALASRLAQHTVAEINDRYALAVKGLVKILTDVNEGEPFWEKLKTLDLHDRSLASLYGLADFCNHVQDMNVSYNALQHLQGTPFTIRRLSATNNQLSSLTSWCHVTNLQYLDISNNRLENLNGLSSLIHLRELRADDNTISCINGILGLDGLLKLRLRRNKLQHLDFGNSQLPRLEALDLCDNEIVGISSLERLPSLAELKLDNNNLANGLSAGRPMPSLTSLAIKNCKIDSLEVSWCPRLKHLDVDDNQISDIKHLASLKDLDILSMRRQTLPDQMTISIFEKPFEASTVYLSGNKLPSLRLSDHFFNVRHLELSSVGLQELPDDFGLRMSNLRRLNLNFNSLRDIMPLLNIHHLEHLTACGNRLHRLRKSIATFEKMETLRTLDLRENPLTQGFYANLVSTMSKNTTLIRRMKDNEISRHEEDKEDAIESSRYELPPSQPATDKQHRARLDHEMELRRRVYEVLIANSCKELLHLDGLEFDRKKALLRDSIWDRLVDLGIIKKSQDSVVVLLE